MNTLLKIVFLMCAAVSADIINTSQPGVQQHWPDKKEEKSGPKDRKLIFSPYGQSSSTEALSVGNETAGFEQGQQNSMMGPFKDAPMPMYGMGGMSPPGLGMTHMPYNYMYGSPMMHPMNPMHGMAAGGMGGVPMSGQEPMGDMSMQGMGGAEMENPSFDGSRELGGIEELPRAQVRVGSYCNNVKKQAVEVANAIMRRQNRIVFKELMNYLLKSKYLIGMTEVKLTRVVRKKIYALMNEYSNIDESNVQFIPVKENVVVQKQIVYKDSENKAEGGDRRKLATKKGRK